MAVKELSFKRKIPHKEYITIPLTLLKARYKGEVSPHTMDVYSYLSLFMFSKKGIFPLIKTIAIETNMSIPSASRAIKKLEALNFIKITHRHGHSNVYKIIPQKRYVEEIKEKNNNKFSSQK